MIINRSKQRNFQMPLRDGLPMIGLTLQNASADQNLVEGRPVAAFKQPKLPFDELNLRFLTSRY